MFVDKRKVTEILRIPTLLKRVLPFHYRCNYRKRSFTNACQQNRLGTYSSQDICWNMFILWAFCSGGQSWTTSGHISSPYVINNDIGDLVGTRDQYPPVEVSWWICAWCPICRENWMCHHKSVSAEWMLSREEKLPIIMLFLNYLGIFWYFLCPQNNE